MPKASQRETSERSSNYQWLSPHGGHLETCTDCCARDSQQIRQLRAIMVHRGASNVFFFLVRRVQRFIAGLDRDRGQPLPNSNNNGRSKVSSSRSSNRHGSRKVDGGRAKRLYIPDRFETCFRDGAEASMQEAASAQQHQKSKSA